MKLRPDDVTPRQWTESQKQLQAKRLKSEAKARGEEYEGGKKEVRDFIEKQALAAGVEKSEAKANAKLVSEFAGTMALRLGVSVQEAAALGSLGQLRISGPKGETVRAATLERFKEFLKPSARLLLEQRLGTMSPEARANEYYLDPVSGLRNERAFDATPDGRQVAVITTARREGHQRPPHRRRPRRHERPAAHHRRGDRRRPRGSRSSGHELPAPREGPRRARPGPRARAREAGQRQAAHRRRARRLEEGRLRRAEGLDRCSSSGE
jgi:hypothetical protein